MASRRAVVRQAIKDWVDAAAIPNLNQTFTSFPKRINFQENSTAGQMTRAAAVVFISSENESRVAVGGAYSGWKRIDYTIEFQIFSHSMHNLAQDAMDAFDEIVDEVKDQLRAGGHRLGKTDGNEIWQAAEPNISVTYGEPKTNDGGATEIWAAVMFTVTQMIQS
jgi:hypothetical protein